MATQRDKAKREKRVVDSSKMAETSMGRVSKAYRLPQGVSLMQVKKEGQYDFDIIPYEAGDGNPAGDKGYLVPGRMIHVHNAIGPNKDTYICPAATFNKPCYVCDQRAKMDQDPDADEKLVRKLAPSKRELWNVVNRKDSEKGVQVLDFSHHCFGKHLFAKTTRQPKYKTFADPDEGFTLSVGATEKDGGGFKFIELADIEFRKRDEPITDAELKATVCFDDILYCPGYDELKAAFHGGSEEDEDDADKDKAPAARAAAKDDDESIFKEGCFVTHEDFGKCKVIHVNEDGTSLKLKDEDGDVHKAVDPDTCELVEEEDDPKPAGRAASAAKTTASAKSPSSEIKLESLVIHEEHGECEVVRIKDGKLTLEDSDGDVFTGVPIEDVTLKPKKGESEKPTANGKPSAKAKPHELPFDEDEEDAPKKPAAKKPARK